ncbi:unnamed protein product [Peronospora farinosa]|uniref:Uncharacterized protein n=1 Tax=Peronospora farinosa TaxID=134698 RepID=A0AAV0U2W4_9STRA|nr:unnamed protein product [Peronospora farinosa]CAI5729328.1 unnamed protein product [Peronospora farinosa]
MKVLLGVALTAAAMLSTSANPCDNFSTAVSGEYIIYNNMWNHQIAGPNSKQCTYLTGEGHGFVSWNTTYTYPYNVNTYTQVKSFANAALKMNPVLLSKVKAINSRMDYTVSNIKRDTVADVAYDLFTSSTPRGKKENEIMIWLAAIGGALPIGNQKLITATIAGYQWHYYVGKNGDMNVYSFVATQQVSAFRGNLMEFFHYVKLNTNQYLIKVECGTEPFVGTDVTLKVSHYSAAIVTA